MRTWLANAAFQGRRAVSGFLKTSLALASLLTVGTASALAQPASEPAGGEASLKLPDLSSVSFLNGAIDGHRLVAPADCAGPRRRPNKHRNRNRQACQRSLT